MLSESTSENFPAQFNRSSIIAALDIGSNSFHLVIARQANGNFQFLERAKQQIQLAAGLDQGNNLNAETIDRAMICLTEFSKLIHQYQPAQIKAVATHTLRIANNAETFLGRAKECFPTPIKIISGHEEAQLIYQGVAHLSNIQDRLLVIDIGGGSTEFVIGSDFHAQLMHSTPVGCINLTQQFFPDSKLNRERLFNLVDAVEHQLAPFCEQYVQSGWTQCLGASGSIRVIDRILKEDGYRKRTITFEHLDNICDQILAFDRLQDIKLPGLLPERAAILPAAVGILMAAFKSFGIEQMNYTRGALREGLLYSLIK